MTCIVGQAANGKVYIGGDSAGSNGWNMVDRADRKVFKTDGVVFGFTTSYRMGQILRYCFKPPKRPIDKDLMEYMVVDFVDALRACLKSAGFAKKENEVESGGVFLVGVEGRLFKIEADYQVGESARLYDACGCGENYALGSLFSSKSRMPRERLKMALQAAESHSAGVRGPFHFEHT